MIAAGVNTKAISTYMGHASITITLDRYGHLLPGNETEAASLLDNWLQIADARRATAEPQDKTDKRAFPKPRRKFDSCIWGIVRKPFVARFCGARPADPRSWRTSPLYHGSTGTRRELRLAFCDSTAWVREDRRG